MSVSVTHYSPDISHTGNHAEYQTRILPMTFIPLIWRIWRLFNLFEAHLTYLLYLSALLLLRYLFALSLQITSNLLHFLSNFA